jgi:hypothetical protein
MSPDDDHTPTQSNLIIEPSVELDGFELYESGMRFLASLGIPIAELERYPQILTTTVGSLLKQVDGYIGEIDEMNGDLRQAAKLVKRLRSQRDALRGALLQAGLELRAADGGEGYEIYGPE